MAAGKSPVKKLLILVLLGAAVVFGISTFTGRGGNKAGGMADMMGAAPPVSVAKALSRPAMQWVSFSGILEAVNAVEIRPRVGGHITAIHFEDGAEVKKGQALFTIDTRPYEAAMISAKASLAEADAALTRAKVLVESNAISRAELDAAQGAYDRARGQYASTQVNLNYAHITAPISGKISRAEVTVGNLVDPAAGQLLASIVDLSPIYASFDMDEQTFLSTIQGVSAEKLKTIPIEVAFGNASEAYTKASVHSFDNQITPGSGTIRVRAALPNADGTLIPGLFARVRISKPDAGEVVLIHPTAVSTDLNKKFVLVVDDTNTAQYREVTLGAVADGLQVITQGLAAGETIIVDGLQRARPGAKVAGTEVDMQTLKALDAPAEPLPAGEPPAEPAAAE